MIEVIYLSFETKKYGGKFPGSNHIGLRRLQLLQTTQTISFLKKMNHNSFHGNKNRFVLSTLKTTIHHIIEIR